MNKKTFTKSVFGQWIVFFGAVAAVVAFFYAVLTYVPYFSNRTYFVIITGSMAPIIEVGDVAVIDKSVDVHQMQVGDIIAFYANLDMKGADEVVVHLIADIRTDEHGKITMHTMRANDNPQKIWDTWEITEDDIIGALDVRLPKIGKFLLFAESRFGKAILLSDVVLFYLIFDLWNDQEEKNRLKLKKTQQIILKNEKK